jgi:hypothetical protein
MRAQHLTDGNMVKTRNAHPSGAGQWLHLTLVGHDAKQIARATLIVRGSSPKGRVTGAENNDSEPFNAVRTLAVALTENADHSAAADLWVPGMTAVQRIELKSLVYSNDSSWRVGDGTSCRVTPDPLMLITSR